MNWFQKYGFFLLCFFFLTFAAVGKDSYVVSARKTENPPVVDGNLDDPAWESAPVLTDFIQFQPHKGDPASVKTVVKIFPGRK